MLIIKQCKNESEARLLGNSKLKEGYKFVSASTYQNVFSFVVSKGISDKIIYNAQVGLDIPIYI